MERLHGLFALLSFAAPTDPMREPYFRIVIVTVELLLYNWHAIHIIVKTFIDICCNTRLLKDS